MEITPKVRISSDKKHYYIYINVHDGGKYPKARIPLKGCKVKIKDWNPNGNATKKNWIRTTHSQYPKLNKLIDDTLTQVKAEHMGLTPPRLISQDKSQASGKHIILEYVEKFMLSRSNSATRANDKAAIKKLRKYLEGLDNAGMLFKEITPQFVKDYYNHILKDNAPGSAKQYLSNFQTFYTSYKEANPDFYQPIHPFKFKKQPTITRNQGLDNDELLRFKSVDLSEYNHKYRIAHSMFLYQFWTAIRFKDVILLKWQNIFQRDNELILDFYIVKSGGRKRITRTLPIQIQLLMLESIERHHPQFKEQIKPLLKSIDKENSSQEITTQEMLSLMKAGHSIEEIEAMMKPNQTNKDLDNLKSILLKIFNDLYFDKPNEYVFYYGNKHSLPDEPWDDETEGKYKQILTSYDYYIKKIAKLAKIRTRVSSHVARHTASQLLMRDGINPSATSAFLGHSSLTTTDIYRGKLGLQDDEIAGYLNKFL